MNRSVKISFDNIQEAISEYKQDVVTALAKYRNDLEKAKAFKDEETHTKAATENARKSIDAARDTFTTTISRELTDLKKELQQHVSMRAGANFMDAVRTYRDFGIKPTRIELAGLMSQALGSPLGYAALNSMLEKVESRYRIDYVSPATYDDDLKAIESLMEDPMYSTPEYATELIRLYKGTPRTIGGKDFGYQWNAISVSTSISGFESQIKKLSSMCDRWTNNVAPTIRAIERYEPVTDEDGEEISPARQLASDILATGADAKIKNNDVPEFVKDISARNTEASKVRERYGIA